MAGPLTRVAAFVARFDFMYPMSCLLTFCGRKVVHIEPEGGPYRGPLTPRPGMPPPWESFARPLWSRVDCEN